MKLFTSKSALPGIVMTLLLVFATFAAPVLADHNSHRHGQQQRYFQHDQKPRHHNGNRGGWHPGWQHSYQHRHRYQHRSRPHHRHHRGHRYGHRHGHRYGYRQGHGRYRDYGRHYNHRGHVYYRGSDLVGALVGGAIIYHLGRELARH